MTEQTRAERACEITPVMPLRVRTAGMGYPQSRRANLPAFAVRSHGLVLARLCPLARRTR
jgi:hypothetical protein